MSDHRVSRAMALVAPVRRRSFALMLGAAAVALSLGASVALQWIESPPAQPTAKVVEDVVPPPMTTTAAPAKVEQTSPKDLAGLTNSEPPTIRQTSPDRSDDMAGQSEPRAAAKPAPDLDVVPPAMTPFAAEAPKQVESAPAPIATLTGAAAGAAVAAAGLKQAAGAQAIPLPRPAPSAETRAATAKTPSAVKEQGRRRAVASYPKRGPLKLIGMLFGGWRN